MTAGRVEPIETGLLSRRTRDALLQAARSGAFPDGRLPPEAELAEQIGVSRTTVRAALQSLEDEGLVTRRRRYGTFIDTQLARSSMRLNRLEPFATLIEQSGHVPSADPQQHIVRAASVEEVDALRLDEAEGCIVVDRILRADGKRVIAMTDVIPLSRLAVPVTEVQHADSTFAFLAAHGKARVEYATSEFIPRVARAGMPKALELAIGAPYIELVELHFDAARTPIAMSTVSIDDGAVRLTVIRRQS